MSAVVTELTSALPAEEIGYRFRNGGDFILDTPDDPTPIWGRGKDVLWAEGEPAMLAGPQGLGKTTLAQQLALGRCGLPEHRKILGYPVAPGQGRVLYLAMDRPRQAARSFQRMVGTAMRRELNDRLVVWEGPPPQDLGRNTGELLSMCQYVGADTVVVDSVKDAVVGLSDDDTAAGYNRARQRVVAAGIELLDVHHVRKKQQGQASSPSIDDIYGSTWITAGSGSVVLLSGSPGTRVVGFKHVKQPVHEVGPLDVIHDHDAGRSHVAGSTCDRLATALLAENLTARRAAEIKNSTTSPTRSQITAARRDLEKLHAVGSAVLLHPGSSGSTTAAALWGPA